MKKYDEHYIHDFTNWLTKHEQIMKEGNTLYMPYPHENLREVGHIVGWATCIEMLHYFDFKKNIITV